MYFKDFPEFIYDFKYGSSSETKTSIVKDITRNIRIKKEVLSNIVLYDEYDIIDGETPEIIAEKFYGNPEYHWIIMLANERFNYITDFPLEEVKVMADDGTYQTYSLAKFTRSNQGTSYNHKVVVTEGQKLEVGSVIADGPCTHNGEMALGKNLLVAFMSWEGHNYEDAIILSQRLVQDDVLTSIHIEEYEVDARDIRTWC